MFEPHLPTGLLRTLAPIGLDPAFVAAPVFRSLALAHTLRQHPDVAREMTLAVASRPHATPAAHRRRRPTGREALDALALRLPQLQEEAASERAAAERDLAVLLDLPLDQLRDHLDGESARFASPCLAQGLLDAGHEQLLAGQPGTARELAWSAETIAHRAVIADRADAAEGQDLAALARILQTLAARGFGKCRPEAADQLERDRANPMIARGPRVHAELKALRGQLRLDEQRFGAALGAFESALRLPFHAPLTEARLRLGLAQTWSGFEDPHTALPILQPALALVPPATAPQLHFRITRELDRLALQLGRRRTDAERAAAEAELTRPATTPANRALLPHRQLHQANLALGELRHDDAQRWLDASALLTAPLPPKPTPREANLRAQAALLRAELQLHTEPARALSELAENLAPLLPSLQHYSPLLIQHLYRALPPKPSANRPPPTSSRTCGSGWSGGWITRGWGEGGLPQMPCGRSSG